MQVSPARRLGRNGQLRILFREVAPPNGIERKVETNLEGVAVAKGEHLKLDNEGGAEVTTPRTRYLTTGIQVMLAASQASPDRDAGQGGQSVGEAGNGAANGASGFKLVGMVCCTGGEFTRTAGRLRFIWSGDVYLLPFSGAWTRCGLSQRHGPW